MKKLLRTIGIMGVGLAVMSVTGYADEVEGIPGIEKVEKTQEGNEKELTPEMLERQEKIEAYHKARLEAKRERARERRAALGDNREDPNIPEQTED